MAKKQNILIALFSVLLVLALGYIAVYALYLYELTQRTFVLTYNLLEYLVAVPLAFFSAADQKGAARDCHCAFCAVPDLPVRLLAGQLAHVFRPAVFDPKRLSVPHPRCAVCVGKLLKQVCILRTLFRA